MKKLKSWVMIAALGLSLMLSGCSEKAAEGPRIGVIQLMEHTSLNMIYDSFKEGAGNAWLSGWGKLHDRLQERAGGTKQYRLDRILVPVGEAGRRGGDCNADRPVCGQAGGNNAGDLLGGYRSDHFRADVQSGTSGSEHHRHPAMKWRSRRFWIWRCSCSRS